MPKKAESNEINSDSYKKTERTEPELALFSLYFLNDLL